MPVLKKKNEAFFQTWSSDMAYVLGFFAADGSMYVNPRGSHYLAFYSNDVGILKKIQLCLESNHKISKRSISGKSAGSRYTLQIGSKKMYKDLLGLGMMKNKSKFLKFPFVPNEYLGDFVRGYFDGDGNVLFKQYFRKDRQRYKDYLATKFICGSLGFLERLREILSDRARLGRGSLFKGDRSFVLSYAKKDSEKLFAFIYNDAKNTLHLDRKYVVFKEAIDNTER